MKRTVDLMAGLAGLLVLAPLLVVLAALVWVSSGAPVLFRQVRVGRGGRDFFIYKFRTMTVAAGAERGSFDAGSTSRVTRIGRVLRAWKLDELPQLWNVVKGDMALVGPRPEVRAWVETYPERWAKVLTVRPGLTDPEQQHLAVALAEHVSGLTSHPPIVTRGSGCGRAAWCAGRPASGRGTGRGTGCR